jgi:tetratricopeptide (TPR) repeat protein
MVQFANAILYQKKSDQKSDRIDISSAFEESRVAVKPVHWSQLEAKRPKTKSHIISKQGGHVKGEPLIRVEVLEKPEETLSLLLSARLCADQGRLDEALVWCEDAIAADRLNLRAHYLCATIQEERGEISEAIKALKRALYLDPDFVVAHFALGSLARRQGKKQEADKHFANMFLLLQGYQPDEILPESDGLTAGSMVEMAGAERSR